MDNETNLWNKKQDDMTVGDSMKVAGVVMIGSIVASLATAGVVYGVAVAAEKIEERRAAKKAANKA